MKFVCSMNEKFHQEVKERTLTKQLNIFLAFAFFHEGIA